MESATCRRVISRWLSGGGPYKSAEAALAVLINEIDAYLDADSSRGIYNATDAARIRTCLEDLIGKWKAATGGMFRTRAILEGDAAHGAAATDAPASG